MKIPGNGWQDGKQGNFFCLHLQCAVIWIARMIEINKIRIQPVINIVNTEDPATMKFLIYFMSGGINGGQVQAIIWREPVLIDPAEILGERSFYDIEFFRI